MLFFKIDKKDDIEYLSEQQQLREIEIDANKIDNSESESDFDKLIVNRKRKYKSKKDQK